MKAKPIPRGYESAIPYLYCRNAVKALAFYKKAFGATERIRMAMPTGKIGHAEIQVAGAKIMLADEFKDMNVLGPQSIGGTPVTVLIYVRDVDAFAKRAVKAGAKIVYPPSDQFYGDRNCKLIDPFGHAWMFASRKENLTPKQQLKRAAALFGTKK